MINVKNLTNYDAHFQKKRGARHRMKGAWGEGGGGVVGGFALAGRNEID